MLSFALNDKIEYSTIPKLSRGRWETAGFNGAILPITEIRNLDSDAQRAVLTLFLQQTLSWYFSLKLK